MEEAKPQDIVAVIRSWSNNQGVRMAVERALQATRVGLVIVVVKDDDFAHQGAVARALASIQDPRLVVREFRWGWTWSHALNAALAEITTRIDVGKEQFQYLLPVSVEVVWEPTHLDQLLAAFEQDADLFVAGTSFDGRFDDRSVPLGPTYEHPRNTFALYALSALRRVAGWSPACDAMGGMEDAMALIVAETLGFHWKQLDLKIPLILGKNWDQAQKQKREEAAIREIGAYLNAVAALAPTRYAEFCRRIGMTP